MKHISNFLEKYSSMLKIKIIEEEVTYKHIVKQIVLLIEDKNINVFINKWDKQDSLFDVYDQDYEITNESEIRDKFTDDEWDNLQEVITDL